MPCIISGGAYSVNRREKNEIVQPQRRRHRWQVLRRCDGHGADLHELVRLLGLGGFAEPVAVERVAGTVLGEREVRGPMVYGAHFGWGDFGRWR